MDTKNANQGVDKTNIPSEKGGVSIGSILVVALLLFGVWNAFRPESEVREAAELRVQNSVYTSVGMIPKTESTVVYKNEEFICVGVNYTFEDSFKTNVYWSRIVCCFRGSGNVLRSSDDWGGVDIHNLTKDQINQIKVLFELE